jgi:hypothetical protein
MAAESLPRPTWRELLRAQQGVISRRQGLCSGLSEEAWSWRLERGLWQSPLPGVAVAHTGTLTFEERVWTAVLYGGPGAVVSGDALIRLLSRQWPEPDRIDVVVHRAIQRSAVRFFRPHRCATVARLTHPVREPPQLRVAPGVLHAAAWAPTDRAGEWRLAAAVQHRLVPVPQLRSALQELRRLPRRELFEQVLDDVELGAHARTELDFLAFLRQHGLPLPDRLQFKFRANKKRYLDAWWERQRVAAEVDGTHHMEVAEWDLDGLRANEIVVAARSDRVVLLRVTSGNLRHARPHLAAQFRAVLL